MLVVVVAISCSTCPLVLYHFLFYRPSTMHGPCGASLIVQRRLTSMYNWWQQVLLQGKRSPVKNSLNSSPLCSGMLPAPPLTSHAPRTTTLATITASIYVPVVHCMTRTTRPGGCTSQKGGS